MKAKDPLLSWKEAPPKTAPERATARLLDELRSSPRTLSPEAFARIERRLKENARRPPRARVLSLAGPWMPVLAGAAATVLVVGAFTLAIIERKTLLGSGADSESRVPSAAQVFKKAAPEQLAKRSSTSDEASPPVVVAGRERFAQPPPPDAPLVAPLGSKSVSRAQKVELGAGANALAGRQDRPVAAAAPRAVAGSASSDTAEQAPPNEAKRALASSESAAVVGSPALIERAEQFARMGRCAAAVPAFTSVLSSAPPDPVIERALYGRASCQLTLGERARGLEDLRTYLSRFPEGRFAAEVRSLLE